LKEVPGTQSRIDPVGRPLMHSSGEKHTTGEAIYTTDVRLPSDCLYLAYVQSPVAIGAIKSLDYSAALKMAGVVGKIDWRDIPGSINIGHGMETPVFAKEKVEKIYEENWLFIKMIADFLSWPTNWGHFGHRT
jgi:xanthine dehydrogenase/oxidase